MVMTTLMMETSDLVEAFKRRVAKGPARKLALSIPLNPVPASRPRVTKWGVHYLKTYATWKKQALIHLPAGRPLFTEPVAILTEHIIKKPKTTKLRHPKGDVDNYMKATLDALTSCEAVWTDDDLVLLALGTKRFANPTEEPRTDVIIVEL